VEKGRGWGLLGGDEKAEEEEEAEEVEWWRELRACSYGLVCGRMYRATSIPWLANTSSSMANIVSSQSPSRPTPIKGHLILKNLFSMTRDAAACSALRMLSSVGLPPLSTDPLWVKGLLMARQMGRESMVLLYQMAVPTPGVSLGLGCPCVLDTWWAKPLVGLQSDAPAWTRTSPGR
jgi:hypothetical protein